MPARHTIAFIQQVAKERSGKCLSLIYENDDTLLKWMCKRGHTWDASYTIIRQGGWCMQCAEQEINDEKLEELKQIAKQKGGTCLSVEYSNNHTQLKWQCKEGHQWEATSRSVREKGCWCPYCSGRIKTIEDMQAKAKEHGGKCLSKVYINSQTKLWWQCERMHKWQAHPNSIYMGRWCRACARIAQAERQRKDVAVYRQHAKKKGGRLLSIEYAYKKTLIAWRCAKGHQWQATGGQVLNSGTWCPYCAQKAKHTIKDMQQLARQKRGKCLSVKYVNNYTRLKWQCRKKHVWMAVPVNIICNGTWCPVCAMDIKKYNLPQYKGLKY